MLHPRQVDAVSRMFRAASGELGDTAVAADAWFRMAYLWAWSEQQGRPLDEEDLEIAIWSFGIEYPDGRPRPSESSPELGPSGRAPSGQRIRADLEHLLALLLRP